MLSRIQIKRTNYMTCIVVYQHEISVWLSFVINSYKTFIALWIRCSYFHRVSSVACLCSCVWWCLVFEFPLAHVCRHVISSYNCTTIVTSIRRFLTKEKRNVFVSGGHAPWASGKSTLEWHIGVSTTIKEVVEMERKSMWLYSLTSSTRRGSMKVSPRDTRLIWQARLRGVPHESPAIRLNPPADGNDHDQKW